MKKSTEKYQANMLLLMQRADKISWLRCKLEQSRWKMVRHHLSRKREGKPQKKKTQGWELTLKLQGQLNLRVHEPLGSELQQLKFEGSE